ncbi:MAG TPA: hypothetical protein DCY79_03195 [Planctomycetaceae bacterium]|nr:hypothetical protein [Blastopirellula sp.]HAY78798.1 hypothetical protein [Planctomycetaceae bacterium]
MAHGTAATCPVPRLAHSAENRTMCGCYGAPRMHFGEVLDVSHKIEGSVVSISDTGNLVTDIAGAQLADAPQNDSVVVQCDDHVTTQIFHANHEQPPMTLIALIGESGNLELEIVDDSAKIMLGVRVGEKVVVQW